MLRVLVAESEFEVRAALRRGLMAEDFEVITAADSARTLHAGLKPGAESFDAIVLDVMLPDLSGYRVLRQLRAAGVEAPILLISANGSEAERAEGLDLGGDSYLAIPFAFALLVAQLRALARRYRGSWRTGHPARALRVRVS